MAFLQIFSIKIFEPVQEHSVYAVYKTLRNILQQNRLAD